MKKGQLLGIPFVYILALILAAFILIFGVRLIFQLQGTAESVEVNQFVDDLRTETERYYNLDEGSSKLINLRLPNKIDQICFKQNDLNQNSLTQQELSFINTDSNNIFLLPLDSYENAKYRINKLQNPSASIENVYCIDNPGSFILESKNGYVEILSSS